jgi:hypothetical protein
MHEWKINQKVANEKSGHAPNCCEASGFFTGRTVMPLCVTTSAHVSIKWDYGPAVRARPG